MPFVSKLTELFTGKPSTVKVKSAKNISKRSLIEKESSVGAKLFGPVPAGHRRDFFCLDKNTWVWHEEWFDKASSQKRTSTTRYEIHTNGVLKAQDGINYQFIDGQELENLIISINLYYERVMVEVYGKDPYTGLALNAQTA